MTTLTISPPQDHAFRQFASTFEGLLLLELLQPSRRLWLVSRRIEDCTVWDNRTQKIRRDKAPAIQQYTLSQYFSYWLSQTLTKNSIKNAASKISSHGQKIF